jgi:hypothetical protein
LTVWQKGKLLDDVRSGALRSVFRDSYWFHGKRG